MSKRFTEGIAFDVTAILDNGIPITITEILNNLNRLDKVERELKKLRIGDVSGRSEQLKCYHYNHEWKSDGQGGNLKYCNDCKCYV